jgi:diacylglycerol kinase family enzyme
MHTTPRHRIPAFLNPAAGRAAGVTSALENTGRFDVHDVSHAQLSTALRAAIENGATRVAVAGGDGTVSAAASVVAGTPVELAVIPAGTLNHFARDLGIPTDPAQAAEVASGNAVQSVDAGYVNGRLMLNTSAAGAYVAFVQTRDRLQKHLGYRLASLMAFGRGLLHLHTYRVVLRIEGTDRIYLTPLVFVGVGERELGVPTLGSRVPGGQRCLHVMIVRGKRRTRLLLLGVAVAARGLPASPRPSRTGIDSFLVDDCRIDMHGAHGHVSVDGEIVRLAEPLAYRIARDALRVVAPGSGDSPTTH